MCHGPSEGCASSSPGNLGHRVWHSTITVDTNTVYNQNNVYILAFCVYILQLESGQVVVHLSLSEETVETKLTLPTPLLSDSESHSLVFHRRGGHLDLSVDSNTTSLSLPPGTPLTLETLSSEIYTGGSPFVPASSWFTGCLQDVRINRVTLPTSSAGNEFASVLYEGSGEGGHGVTKGCSLSPCYLDPCGGGGVCEETSNGSYQCLCSGRETVSGRPCPHEQEMVQFLPYVIAGGSVFVMVVVATVGLCGKFFFMDMRVLVVVHYSELSS